MTNANVFYGIFTYTLRGEVVTAVKGRIGMGGYASEAAARRSAERFAATIQERHPTSKLAPVVVCQFDTLHQANEYRAELIKLLNS